MKSNFNFAASTSFKMMMAVAIIGMALTMFKSPVFLGIAFISAAYIGYTVLAVLATGVISFFTSLFMKKAPAPVVEPARAQYVHEQEVKEEVQSALTPEVIQAAMAKMSPEQLQDLIGKVMADAGATSKKK